MLTFSLKIELDTYEKIYEENIHITLMVIYFLNIYII